MSVSVVMLETLQQTNVKVIVFAILVISCYLINSLTINAEDVCTSVGCGDNEECVIRGESSKCECKEGYIKHEGQCVEGNFLISRCKLLVTL